MLKCVKCGSFGALKVVVDKVVTLDLECTICGREYSIHKIPVGKKGYGAYVGAISQQFLKDTYIVIEATGNDILRALIVVGLFVAKDKVATILDVDVGYRIDKRKKVVPTVRVLAEKKDFEDGEGGRG